MPESIEQPIAQAPEDDLIDCAYCGRPIPYDEAEPIEDNRGFGPLLVCPTCFEK